ncbi:NAD(P)/FAD-dependent oxidoreductase [Micromonospora sp. WMMA1998]|uniref:NAD(P)/FAD-dependent oxidoreductase n=1 Tax=Micromonospora sp. WMMA1998 TaxID=3015167 RepID=UPI00248AA5C0|nr:NAD(P)/FAD-dependent oxidoreductase [Micromonospora sp. WMMA1998]WBC14935.1 NAD(P)/FAD-dependent oxidoreductase [Micromonospora sp. WMMA1998]
MSSEISSRIAALPADKRAALLRQLRLQQSQNDASHGRYDVAILGGGVAGLTLALQLVRAHQGIRVAVIERQLHPVPEAAHKVGESTVEIAAHYLRDILGMDDHLGAQQLRKFGLRMFFSNGDNKDISERLELGSSIFPPLSTYQLDRGRLENALGDRVRDAGVEFLAGCKVVSVRLRPEETHHLVTVGTPEGERVIRARWVVDASGRSQVLRKQLSLAKEVDHAANAVWMRVAHPIDVKEWTDDPAWQARIPLGDRALSTNHLMGAGYWVWLIRLASGSISIGIVTDADQHRFDEMNTLDRALEWLRRHEPQCARAVEEHLDKVQDFRVMKDYAYGCKQVYSGDRWCLTGEAGVFLDPLYSPGLDMIAISNGLVTDLVTRSLAGEDVRGLAEVHDRAFLSVVDIWLAIYAKQYSLMDSAQVMVSKIIWDTAFYWGVFGLLFFHDKFRTLVDRPKVAASLARLTELSNRVQAFYREWHAIDTPVVRSGFVDLYAPLNFMVRLHHGMAAELSPAAFDEQFAANVRLFEQMAGQLISAVIATYAEASTADQQVFAQIQRWQTEPLIAELITAYRRESRHNPTSDGWIALGAGGAQPATRQEGQAREQQPVEHVGA